ncbi:MAG: LemA family protein [Rhodocyclaceae bacterium]|nr:LemA family protein [Rhodocyclaceae bacterium]
MACLRTWILMSLSLFFAGCGYNQIQINDEAVKAAWAEVLNQYQRRADLVPNLVEVVKGYAAHEQEVLTKVTEARARVAAFGASAQTLEDPQALAAFQKAQGELTNALSRLLVVVENYPQLKADTVFRDLQAQLEGTENRIAVARNRYIKAVETYNVSVRTFPNVLTAWVMGWTAKPTFAPENETALKEAPAVRFSPQPSR